MIMSWEFYFKDNMKPMEDKRQDQPLPEEWIVGVQTWLSQSGFDL